MPRLLSQSTLLPRSSPLPHSTVLPNSTLLPAPTHRFTFPLDVPPSSGALFALEEVSTFWNTQLTMFTFCIVFVAGLTAKFWASGMDGRFDPPNLVCACQEGVRGWEGSPFSRSHAHPSQGSLRTAT